MPRVSQEHLLARERGIVQAAARCLQRKGLEGTGMRDLFRAANLSPGAVYRYFSSKEELIAAVAATGPGLVEMAIAASADDRTGLVEPRRLLEAAAAGPPVARLECELETAALHSPRVAAALARRRHAAREALARALGRDEADDLLELAIGLCEALARRRLLEPDAELGGPIRAAARLLGQGRPHRAPRSLGAL